MRKTAYAAVLAVACLGVARAQDDKDTRGSKDTTGHSDERFVLKASEGGLAEVNTGSLAARLATHPEVKQFAAQMVKDHTMSNTELIALANAGRFKVAMREDAEHQAMAKKLAKLTGAAFDRAYMAGQVKDHEVTVALFEKEGKEGKNEDLRKWAKKTLPILRMHLKMARQIHGKLKGGATEDKDKSR